MSATLLRTVLHVGGLVAAVLLFLFLPFSPLVNGLIAGFIWLMDGTLAEVLFKRLATMDEKLRDLRERVDNPPS